MAAPRKTINIGVFIPTRCQLLDQACVDVLATMSHEYLAEAEAAIGGEESSSAWPEGVLASAPSVRVHYVGGVAAGRPIALTADQHIVCTHHYADAEVAPGKLDVVIVPGPDPRTEPDAAALEWLRRQAAEGADVLSVCTGIFLCGQAGLLKGRQICGPRGMQDLIQARFGPDIVQRGSELRWVQDGNFWSSGGVTNGNDLMAAYARHKSDIFPRPVVEIALGLVDVGDRPQAYAT